MFESLRANSRIKRMLSAESLADESTCLVRAMACGDEEALSAFYERFGRYVFSYLLGRLSDAQLAEEALQDVMVAVWRGARGFRGASSVQTWVLTIARRIAIRAQNRVRADALPLNEESALPDAPDSSPAELREALRRLPADQREALELVFYHGLSGAEAARVLGVAEGTVKSRLHRAKVALRELMDLST